MKRHILTLLLAGAFSFNATAQGSTPSYRVTDLALDRCELAEVIARIQYESIERAAAIAEQSKPILRELEKLNAKARYSDRPLIDQLAPEDIARFAELSQRLKSTQLAQLMESRRERDLKVIQKMVVFADRDYRWNDHPRENDPDYIVFASLQLLRLMTKKHDITVPKSPVCSLEFALHRVENEAITKLNAINVEAAMVSLKSILARYNMEKIDRSRLSRSDLQRLNELENNVLRPAQRHNSFIRDIENIKIMARASEVIYESNKQDIAFGGGDIDSLGRTIQRRTQNNEFDDDTRVAIGLWSKINEKIPSDVVKDWAELRKLMEAFEGQAKSKPSRQ